MKEVNRFGDQPNGKVTAPYLMSHKTRYGDVSVCMLVFFSQGWLSGVVGGRKSCSDPQLIYHLNAKGTKMDPVFVCGGAGTEATGLFLLAHNN